MVNIGSSVLVLLLVFAHGDADAGRMGGSSSLRHPLGEGTAQRQVVAAAAAPVRGPANTATASGSQAGGVSPAKPWSSRLGSWAAGLGLVWLAHALGLGTGWGVFLAMALLALAGVAIGRVVHARRGNSRRASTAFQSAGATTPDQAQVLAQYSPHNVGNDASARPWERNSMSFEVSRQQQGTGAVIGSGFSTASNWGTPEGFDVKGFLATAKRNFVTLQSAWDRSDIATLRSMMTDSMVDEIRTQLVERETHRGKQPNYTDVVMIDARLLGIEDLGDGYLASVEFSGMIREEPSASPGPFREVWNMSRSKAGTSGWLVAGVQALSS